MTNNKMTPQEVAIFWFKKSTELEAKLKDSEDIRRDLANEVGDLKNRYTALKLAAEEDVKRLEKRIDNEIGRVYQKESDVDIYRKRWIETRNKIEAMQSTITNMSNRMSEIDSMTYEQIIDLKCENARLKEENAKFVKWKRILDKFKIF